MTDLSRLQVIVVNYGSAVLAQACVRSLIAHGVTTLPNVTIVDNHSPDDSLARLREAFPEARLVAAQSNRGFGAGVNLGARCSDSDYILVLNPDTYFESDTVSPVLAYLDRETDVGIVGLDLVNIDGTRQFSARRFYSLIDIMARRVPVLNRLMGSRMADHLMVRSWLAGHPFDAEWVMGTGMIIRRTLFQAIGGMDEGYFLYMEDVDLCARVWKAGKRVVGLPGSYLTHAHQRMSAISPYGRQARIHLVSLLRFACKFRVGMIRQPGITRVIN